MTQPASTAVTPSKLRRKASSVSTTLPRNRPPYSMYHNWIWSPKTKVLTAYMNTKTGWNLPEVLPKMTPNDCETPRCETRSPKSMRPASSSIIGMM